MSYFIFPQIENFSSTSWFAYCVHRDCGDITGFNVVLSLDLIKREFIQLAQSNFLDFPNLLKIAKVNFHIYMNFTDI